MKINQKIKNIRAGLLSEFLFTSKKKRLAMFNEQPVDKKVEIIRTLTPKIRHELVSQIATDDLVVVLENLDPDEATDLLQSLNKQKREKVLHAVSSELKNSLSTLLEFDPETAAGLMTLDYIQVDSSDNVAAVAKKFKQHEKSTGRLPVILVMEGGKLKGYLPGHELGFANRNQKIDKFVKRMLSTPYSANHDEVIRLFSKHPHNKVAVLNENQDVIGIIYSDDILKLIESKESDSLYDFAGIHDEETVTDSIRNKVKNRYRWLIINLFTAFLASFVVSQFQGTLSKYVLLAVYMPIVAGMGGNAGTQTLAVLVRGISLRQIELKTAYKTLLNEIGAAFANGLINAVIVAVIVYAFNRDMKVSLILAAAMVINLIVAATFGTLVPLVMSRFGKDPASSATIFITTATDILGFFVFLGLASIVLK